MCGKSPVAGDHLPAFSLGGAPPSRSSRGSSVGGDWSIMLGWHGGSPVPNACSKHVWKTVFKVQVTLAQNL